MTDMDKNHQWIEADKIIDGVINGIYDREELFKVKEIISEIVSVSKERIARDNIGLGDHPYARFDPFKETSKVISAINNSMIFLNQAEEDLKYLDRQSQDILHAIELLNNSDEELFDLAKELMLNRRERRKCKDFIEQVRPLAEALEGRRDSVLKSLRKASGEIAKVQQHQQTRKYTVREKTTLQEAFESLGVE